MSYKLLNQNDYYRKGVFRHFTEDCKCSVSLTNKIDVTPLIAYSKSSGTSFYVNFLYLLSKTLNSREDYRMHYIYQTGQLAVFDKINPTQYVFHQDTETITVAYTEYTEDYAEFYKTALADLERAKNTREYGLDNTKQGYFDASYLPWLSYESMNLELPDGYFYFLPIVNWSRYKEENGRFLMPVTVRLNHAVADGYHIATAFVTLQKLIDGFAG